MHSLCQELINKINQAGGRGGGGRGGEAGVGGGGGGEGISKNIPHRENIKFRHIQA